MRLISWERPQERDPHKLFSGGIFDVKNGVPNGPFSAPKSLVYCFCSCPCSGRVGGPLKPGETIFTWYCDTLPCAPPLYSHAIVAETLVVHRQRSAFAPETPTSKTQTSPKTSLCRNHWDVESPPFRPPPKKCTVSRLKRQFDKWHLFHVALEGPSSSIWHYKKGESYSDLFAFWRKAARPQQTQAKIVPNVVF